VIIGTNKFPRSTQRDDYSCGPRCVKSILDYFGIRLSYREIYKGCKTTTDGSSAIHIILFLRGMGLRVGFRPNMSLRDLTRALKRGCAVLAYTHDSHFVVVYGRTKDYIYLSDPDVSSTKGLKVSVKTFRSFFNNWGVTVRK
jgi:ABC-type bacteriocin/lantibiotic exporter with double-glycine peptidase domain